MITSTADMAAAATSSASHLERRIGVLLLAGGLIGVAAAFVLAVEKYWLLTNPLDVPSRQHQRHVQLQLGDDLTTGSRVRFPQPPARTLRSTIATDNDRGPAPGVRADLQVPGSLDLRPLGVPS